MTRTLASISIWNFDGMLIWWRTYCINHKVSYLCWMTLKVQLESRSADVALNRKFSINSIGMNKLPYLCLCMIVWLMIEYVMLRSKLANIILSIIHRCLMTLGKGDEKYEWCESCWIFVRAIKQSRRSARKYYENYVTMSWETIRLREKLSVKLTKESKNMFSKCKKSWVRIWLLENIELICLDIQNLIWDC